ncbi:MAG TPA: hypothetical protein VGF53_01465 [Pseudolabrys sp.]|jgi:hypothetical protein
MTRYWFRPKRYGYGATPTTWEGWAVTITFAGILAVSIVAMELLAGPTNFRAWLIWGAIVATATWWFIQFSRRHTDGEWRWRWGGQSDTLKS